MRHLLATVAALAVALPAFAGDIKIMDAYARSNGPSAANGAVFMMIRSDVDDVLVGARTDASRMAELHTHIEDTETGLVKMREVEGGIAVPADAGAHLMRGGDHVMLMGLTGPLTDGESFDLTLVFEKAGEVTVTVPVDQNRKPAMDHSGHGTMKHGSDS